MRRFLPLAIMLINTAALAQSPPVADPNSAEAPQGRAALRGQAQELVTLSQSLGDWNKHYRYLMDSVERVYDRNEWKSEADLFSVELIRAVQSKPPWAFEERLDTFLNIVGDRYLLDDDQRASLENLVIREGVGAFAENAPRIMQYIPEIIRARAEGEPFTPEQVAKWSQLAEPVFQDIRNRFNRASREFVEDLEPEQRKLVMEDVEATNHRMTDIYRLSKEWQKGGWKAEDWGLDNDPIQAGEERGAESDSPETAHAPTPSSPAPEPHAAGVENPVRPIGNSGHGGVTEPPAAPTPQPSAGTEDAPEPPPARDATPKNARPLAENNDPWAKYVSAFIEKFALNEEQQQRAWLFYDDAVKRRDVFSKRGGSDATANNRTNERLFTALERRLDQLPTRAQRKAASSTPLPKPTASAPARGTRKP